MMKNIANYIYLLLLSAFGLLTLFLTLSIVFDLFDIRAKEGHYVPFIVWANMICGMLYLIAAVLYFKKYKKTYLVLLSAFVVLLIGFIALLIYIANGGVYETKTIGAMIFRMVVTLIFTGVAYRKQGLK